MLRFFQKIIEVLNGQNIQYMLSGSVAMSLYVIPRATRDFDFIIHLRPEDVATFAANFAEGYYCNVDSVKTAVREYGMFNIIDHESGYKADFIVLKKDEFRQKEFKRKIKMDYYGSDIFVVTPEDLIISKLIWIQDLQSGVQQEDIKSLSAIEGIDWNYIKYWIAVLKLNTFSLLSR